MTYKALMDAITKLGHLLERPDLTMDKRHKYQAELLKLTRKLRTASDLAKDTFDLENSGWEYW